MNINKALKKAYETRPLVDIANANVSALEGISEEGAAKIKQALGVKTVKDLASNKYVLWAQAIVNLAETEEKK